MEGDAEQGREAIPDDGGRWLTYAEIAAIRGIGRPSAVKLVQRERWRRIPGNDRDRTVRVYVPADWLRPAKDALIPEGIPDVIRDNIPELSVLVAQLEQVMTFVRDRAEAAEARADRAEAAIAGERARADSLRDRAEAQAGDLAFVRAALDQAQGEARTARERADAMARAETERRGRGVLARLRAALRGEP